MICQGCEIDKVDATFPVRKDRSNKRRPYCYACMANMERARYDHHKRTAPFKLKCSRAKSRSQYLKVPFDLTPEYLESMWTGVCPVLLVPISYEGDRTDEYVAELDRFVPDRGYVQGNVHFLSRRANRLKNNVSTKELKQLIHWMEKYEDC